MSALTFGLLIGSIDALGHGEAFPLFLLEMLATFGIGYVLVKRQLAHRAPLLPIDLMRIPIFALSVGTSVSSFAAQMLALVSLPFLFQLELHYTAVETGLFITPWHNASAEDDIDRPARLLQEELMPIDEDVFVRQVEYNEALTGALKSRTAVTPAVDLPK